MNLLKERANVVELMEPAKAKLDAIRELLQRASGADDEPFSREVCSGITLILENIQDEIVDIADTAEYQAESLADLYRHYVHEVHFLEDRELTGLLWECKCRGIDVHDGCRNMLKEAADRKRGEDETVEEKEVDHE